MHTVDLGITIQALRLRSEVAEKTLLRDATGGLWEAGPSDGYQVVWPLKLGQTLAGDVLTAEDGTLYHFDVETLLTAGGIYAPEKQTYLTGDDGQRLPSAAPVVLYANTNQVPLVREFAARLRGWVQLGNTGAKRGLLCHAGFQQRRSGKTVISVVLIFAALLEGPSAVCSLFLHHFVERAEVDGVIDTLFTGWTRLVPNNNSSVRVLRLGNGATMHTRISDKFPSGTCMLSPLVADAADFDEAP